jgi:hypothetical protein
MATKGVEQPMASVPTVGVPVAAPTMTTKGVE